MRVSRSHESLHSRQANILCHRQIPNKCFSSAELFTTTILLRIFCDLHSSGKRRSVSGRSRVGQCPRHYALTRSGKRPCRKSAATLPRVCRRTASTTMTVRICLWWDLQVGRMCECRLAPETMSIHKSDGPCECRLDLLIFLALSDFGQFCFLHLDSRLACFSICALPNI
jgi:hypothetical protein